MFSKIFEFAQIQFQEHMRPKWLQFWALHPSFLSLTPPSLPSLLPSISPISSLHLPDLQTNLNVISPTLLSFLVLLLSFLLSLPSLPPSISTSLTQFLNLLPPSPIPPPSHLQTYSHVDPAAESGADGTWRQAQVFEELGEGLGEGDAWPLFCHHHARAHTWQVHVTQLHR